MRAFIVGLVMMVACLAAGICDLRAQQPNFLCVAVPATAAQGAGTMNCQLVSATNPLPITGGGSSATYGAAFPATGTPLALDISGLAQPWFGLTNGGVNYGLVGVVDNTGTQLNGYATGIAGTPSTQVLTVQGAASMTPVQVNMAPQSGASAGITPVVGGSAVSSLVLKSSAGNLYSTYATCTAACWLMVFNAVSAPSNGATTAGVASGNMVECIPIGANGLGGVNYSPGPPAVYSVGMTATISSTGCATLTLATTGFIHGLVQ